MSAIKDKAIKRIMNDFESFSKLTLQQLELLAKIIASEHTKVSAESLKQVKKNERKIDAYEIKISNRIINAIVLYKPVASELRNLMAAYRMITNLERIGDLIMKVVFVLRRLKDTSLLILNLEDINKMLGLTSKMVSKATSSFAYNDKNAALWTIESDIIVDDLNHRILKNSMLEQKKPGELQKMILNFMGVKSIVSSIERIADHAEHIAEASIYAFEGTDVRHPGSQKN